MHSMSFIEFLVNNSLSPKRIYQLYGVYIGTDGNAVRVLQTGYKFHNLVEDKSLIQKCIVDSHTKLKEASRVQGSGVTSKPCACPYETKTKRYYVIDIPKEYTLEVNRIQKLKQIQK